MSSASVRSLCPFLLHLRHPTKQTSSRQSSVKRFSVKKVTNLKNIKTLNRRSNRRRAPRSWCTSPPATPPPTTMAPPPPSAAAEAAMVRRLLLNARHTTTETPRTARMGRGRAPSGWARTTRPQSRLSSTKIVSSCQLVAGPSRCFHFLPLLKHDHAVFQSATPHNNAPRGLYSCGLLLHTSQHQSVSPTGGNDHGPID